MKTVSRSILLSILHSPLLAKLANYSGSTFFLMIMGALLGTQGAHAETSPYAAKVVIIGIDGVSLNLLQPFSDRGVTPHMGKLIKEGSASELASIWPLRTPQVWTSIATGKLPGQHGIWDHLTNTYFNPPEVRTQKKARVTSADRKSKALWQILGEHNLKTVTVGWMASWPAEKVDNGVMVAPIELMGDKRQTTIKGSFYKGEKQMVSPLHWDKTVQKLIIDPASITDKMLLPYATLPKKGSPILKLPSMSRYIYGLRWSLARAKSVEKITHKLVTETRPDVVLSYFQCPDSLLHRFWIFQKSPAKIKERLATHKLPQGQAKALHKYFSNVVEQCYRDVDARVGRLLKATRGENTLVLIVSDHGFGSAPVPHKMKGEPYSGDHLENGILLAAGPGITAASHVAKSSVLDITPTVLHYLNLPVGKDMKGKVIKDWFNLVKRPVKRIASYEEKPQLSILRPHGWPIRH